MFRGRLFAHPATLRGLPGGSPDKCRSSGRDGM